MLVAVLVKHCSDAEFELCLSQIQSRNSATVRTIKNFASQHSRSRAIRTESHEQKASIHSMAAKASGAAAAARRQSVGVDAIASQAFVAQWRACATTGRKSTAELPILMRCEIRCASSRNKESSDPTPCSDQANQRAQLYTIEANWHQCPSLYLPLAPCKRHAEAKQQGMREW